MVNHMVNNGLYVIMVNGSKCSSSQLIGDVGFSQRRAIKRNLFLRETRAADFPVCSRWDDDLKFGY